MAQGGQRVGAQIGGEQLAQQGRDGVHHGDRGPLEPGRERGAAGEIVAAGHHDRAAARQRRQDVAEKGVEGGPGELAHPRAWADQERLDLPVDEVIDAPAPAGDGLGRAGRARGEVDVAQLVGAGLTPWPPRRLAGHGRVP